MADDERKSNVIHLRPKGEQFHIPAYVELEDGKFVSTLNALRTPELRDQVIARCQAEIQEKIQEFESILRLAAALAEGRISPEDLGDPE